MKIPKNAKPFPELPTYAVTPKGEVFNVVAKRQLMPTNPLQAPKADPGRHLASQVHLALGDGRSKTYYVSYLVLTAHVGPRPSTHHVAAHLNGVELDDRLANLRWMTYTELAARRIKDRRTAKGSQHGRAKLTESEVVEIKRRLMSGDSPGEIAPDYAVARRLIAHIKSGGNWADVKVNGRQWPPQDVVDEALAKKQINVDRARERRHARAMERLLQACP